eukprot:TRINITY_DN7996_c0_g1_i1.p1 TRINITY_DN7996_c0_g1~~TRINITY_DN7996_c0_g1_i1.p1  ORF type:complete len:142 (-),score=13.89 TRINITY_DN7996_c0_g1_i1:168-593(-)
MDEAVVQTQFSSRVIFHQVQLKHIDCLYRVLKDFTVVDPFSNVRSRYRDPLDEKTAENLVQNIAPHLKLDLLLPTLKEFIASHLTEDTLTTSSTIKEMLNFYDDEDNFHTMPWFKTGFPNNITLSNVVDVYNKLEEVDKSE